MGPIIAGIITSLPRKFDEDNNAWRDRQQVANLTVELRFSTSPNDQAPTTMQQQSEGAISGLPPSSTARSSLPWAGVIRPDSCVRGGTLWSSIWHDK